MRYDDIARNVHTNEIDQSRPSGHVKVVLPDGARMDVVSVTMEPDGEVVLTVEPEQDRTCIGELPLKSQHVLSQHNRIDRIAVCSTCGLVEGLLPPRGIRPGVSYAFTDMRCPNDRDRLIATYA
jgi:hypothetical protein